MTVTAEAIRRALIGSGGEVEPVTDEQADGVLALMGPGRQAPAEMTA